MEDLCLSEESVADALDPAKAQGDAPLDVLKSRLLDEAVRRWRSDGINIIFDPDGAVLYGFDASASSFWFRNDPRGAALQLPLRRAEEWPPPPPA